MARYYRSDLQRNHPVSTEITGYTASALIYLHSVTRDPAYLERAIRTARFLTRCAWDSAAGTFPFEYPHRDFTYFFDCGIIVRGLLAVYRTTQDREFLNAALDCGRAMIADFDAGADFHPILRLPGKDPVERDARWSRSPGCYQLKSALGWFELAEETGDAAFRAAWDRVLAYSLESHRDFLPGSAEDDRVMDRLHAYCYFLEALLATDHTDALREGVDRVAHFLHKIAPSFARSDVYAQLLRLRLFIGQMADEEARALADFQIPESGGFYFGGKNGAMLPYINPVSTAFGMQALEMWRENQIPCRQLLV